MRRSKGATSSTSSTPTSARGCQPVHRPDDPRAVSLGRDGRLVRQAQAPRRSPPGPPRSAPAPCGRRPSWGSARRGRSTPPTGRSIRSASSRTRARRTVPLSSRLSSEAKTGGGSPACRRRCQGKGDQGRRGDDGRAPDRRLLVDAVRCSRFSVMVNVTSFVVGAVSAASAAAGPVSMEASAPTTWSVDVGTGLSHGHGEEPVLRLELVLRPPAPEGDASDACRACPAATARRRTPRRGPGRTRRSRGGR